MIRKSDHPRSRGEYFEYGGSFRPSGGSSPLSRGILLILSNNRDPRRIIPALAGNTCPSLTQQQAGADHPRSRGEYLIRVVNVNVVVGSSPLSRGIPCRRNDAERRGRIIPALAGNTIPRDLRYHSTSDHPRSRGEYIDTAMSSESHDGSSPLSRGILSTGVEEILARRIIPALAGNTPLSQGSAF